MPEQTLKILMDAEYYKIMDWYLDRLFSFIDAIEREERRQYTPHSRDEVIDTLWAEIDLLRNERDAKIKAWKESKNENPKP